MIIFRKRLKRYYIVSPNPDLEKHIISPAVPNNFLSKGKFWDTSTPRVRLYETIGDAISGIYLGQKLGIDTILYVYEIINLDRESLVGPVGIDKVPYFRLLNEWWYLRNCLAKFLGTIKIDKLVKEETYLYGPKQTKSKLYRWEWSEILKPWEKFKKLEKHYSDPLGNLNERQLEKLADKVTVHRQKKRAVKRKLDNAKNNNLASNRDSKVSFTALDKATNDASKLLNYNKAVGSERNVMRRELINIIRNDNSD